MSDDSTPRFEIINDIKFIYSNSMFGLVPCWTQEELKKRELKFYDGCFYYDEDKEDYMIYFRGEWMLMKDAENMIIDLEELAKEVNNAGT